MSVTNHVQLECQPMRIKRRLQTWLKVGVHYEKMSLIRPLNRDLGNTGSTESTSLKRGMNKNV